MFAWGKEKERRKAFEALIQSYLPKPVVSISTLGTDGSLAIAEADLIFVLIEDENPEHFSLLASFVIRLGVEKKLELVGNVGGLLQFAVGPRSDGADVVHLQTAFISELSKEAGRSVRIAFGRLRCHIGIVGVAERKTWGCYPIAMHEVLKKLLSAPAGAVMDLGL